LLIETDVLLAALNLADPANLSARKVLDQDGLLLSPFSLLEINLLGRAGKLEIKNFGDFSNYLGALLEMSSIRVLNDRPEYYSEAHRLEQGFRLAFFDNLHAAVSKVLKEIMISYDRAYYRLGKEGVKRLDPSDI
jgi:predicted nucleic acid-binding protein